MQPLQEPHRFEMTPGKNLADRASYRRFLSDAENPHRLSRIWRVGGLGLYSYVSTLWSRDGGDVRPYLEMTKLLSLD